MTVALQGDQGKPRPALVVQANQFADLPGVTILRLTSTLIEASILRIMIYPSSENGLTQRSQVMIDKPQTPAKGKVGVIFGRLDDATLLAVSHALAVCLGAA